LKTGKRIIIDLERIVVVSITGTCTIIFGHDFLDDVPIFLKPGDILILTGSSRFDWTHRIDPVDFDVVDGIQLHRQNRISITLRKLVPNHENTISFSMD
jgi:alkylated DNA repair dioxygenase AlkB